jgi:hypothetical protein
MRWGRRWGHWYKVPGDIKTKINSRWGAEDNDPMHPSSGRVMVRKIRDIFVPCNVCARRPKCAKFVTFTRKMSKHGEYSQGTNIMDYCDVYLSNKSPGKMSHDLVYNRTRGKEPT